MLQELISVEGHALNMEQKDLNNRRTTRNFTRNNAIQVMRSSAYSSALFSVMRSDSDA